MSPTTAPQSTPSKLSRGSTKHNGVGNPTSLFVSMAVDMSWRLALVTLVPIIGGAEIDKHTSASPACLIVGFIIAMIGMALVLWQTLQRANALPVPKLTAAEKRAIKKQYDEDDN